jgi:hypothetical protein
MIGFVVLSTLTPPLSREREREMFRQGDIMRMRRVFDEDGIDHRRE